MTRREGSFARTDARGRPCATTTRDRRIPTSIATTRAAPRRSRQSVNPPVDAPASSASRRSGSTPKRSSAAASLSPPRETNPALARAATTIATSAATMEDGLTAVAPPTRTRPESTAVRASSRSPARPLRTISVSSLRRTGVASVARVSCRSRRETARRDAVRGLLRGRALGRALLRGALLGRALPRGAPLPAVLKRSNALAKHLDLLAGGQSRRLHLTFDFLRDEGRDTLPVPRGPLQQILLRLLELLAVGSLQQLLREFARLRGRELACRGLHQLAEFVDLHRGCLSSVDPTRRRGWRVARFCLGSGYPRGVRGHFRPLESAPRPEASPGRVSRAVPSPTCSHSGTGTPPSAPRG